MSYSLSATAPRNEIRKALADEIAKIEQTDTRVFDERNDHLTAAMVVVDRLLEAVGRPEDQVTVSITGHANADHAPAPDWANEFLTITVNAVPVLHEGGVVPEDAPA